MPPAPAARGAPCALVLTMRALVVVVLVACAVGTEQASSNWFVYQDRLKYTSSELHEICDSPWSALGGVAESFVPGAAVRAR